MERLRRARDELQEQRNREIRVQVQNDADRQRNRHEEHIRQARERMDRIRRQAELDAMTRRANTASQAVQASAKKSSKSDCKAGLQLGV